MISEYIIASIIKLEKNKMANQNVINGQALADLLDDLTQEEMANLINHLWVQQNIVSRGGIKAFRKNIGKPIDNR